jgi:DNA processing protein
MSSTTSATPDLQRAPPSAEALALIRFGLVPGFRGDALRRLCEAFGSLQSVLEQPPRRLAEALPPALAERLRAGPADGAEARALAWAREPGHRLLTPLDPDYPVTLQALPDAPPLLWLNGDAGLLQHPALAIVGSRRASPQGLLDARGFARHLGEAGLTILSGLAVGIDGAAHEGGLATLGRTVAVLAHGLDRIYPPVHRTLAHRIADEGLLVSEFPLGTPALRAHFPERNRVISGLSLGVLVIEAALGSGSLLTARHALEQGREVMALPGSIHAPLSKGCHQLIREGATLVETGQDVWAQLAGPLQRFGVLGAPPQAPPESLQDEDPVLFMLQGGPAGIDQIAAAIGLTAAQVSSILGREEVGGRVARLPDGRYQRLGSGPG